MPQSKQVRTIVGRPMTPDLMAKIGGLDQFPPAPPGFDPSGAWVQTYRIHTCHGYFESGNDDEGLLRLERIPGSGDTFTLKIHHKIVNDEGRTNLVDAAVECRTDPLATPISWKLASRFVDLEGESIAGLGSTESGSSAEGSLTLRLGESELLHNTTRPVTADWCLFEAVQRASFTEPPATTFDLLEGLRLPRDEHRLTYRGRYRWKGKPAALHWFHQIGYGVLPYEYWLDDQHRLLGVGTHARAYILDDDANARVEKRFRQIYAKKTRSRS